MQKQEIRTGFGFDIHRLGKGKKLIIGGFEIPFEKGLIGHSDGDLVLHAICDAALGAVCGGEIGEYFPPTKETKKGISSVFITKEILKIIKKKGGEIVHIDTTIVAQAPKMKPHYLEVRKSLNKIFKIGLENISFKSKSHEGLGDIGKGKAIEAFAVVNVKINTEKKK
jgi:2-C-methyl-D-erythritol 2,4-cyclodiphosphate synthase